MSKPHLPVGELKFHGSWTSPDGDYAEGYFKLSSVGKEELEALITAETQKAISRVLDEVEKIIGKDEDTKPREVILPKETGMQPVRTYLAEPKARNDLRAEQRATLKKLREKWL